MCSILTSALGNKQSAGDISDVTMFLDGQVCYIGLLAGEDGKLSFSPLRHDVLLPDLSNRRVVYVNSLMYYVDPAISNRRVVYVNSLMYYVDPASEEVMIAFPNMVVDHNDGDRHGFATTKTRTWRTRTKARAGLLRSFLRWSF